MQRSDFQFELPADLIAQAPPARRGDSRLLCLEADGGMADRTVRDLPSYLRPGDLLVFNDTRVIPARLFGAKDSGGRVEVLVERVLDEARLLAQVRASKPPRPGTQLHIDGATHTLEVEAREDEFFRLRLAGEGTVLELLERAGHVPLPPYIERADEAGDRERYQTIFARAPGAVAAPTAGLHFDEALLTALRDRGARVATLTLHVGAGTFQPMRAQRIEDHRMHAEHYVVDEGLARAYAETRAAGGRVVAIGTTSLRALESCVNGDGTALAAGAAETRIFITPGHRFRAVDALFTNFHLPESTLLMLVSAFAGHARTLAAYRHAVAARYRFFSYGDAMWIPRRAPI